MREFFMNVLSESIGVVLMVGAITGGIFAGKALRKRKDRNLAE